jgi:hypothetical protein
VAAHTSPARGGKPKQQKTETIFKSVGKRKRKNKTHAHIHVVRLLWAAPYRNVDGVYLVQIKYCMVIKSPCCHKHLFL